MIKELIKIIWKATSFGFDAVIDIFDAVGIPWVSAVCIMVLVSVILRLFGAQFIGGAIRTGYDNHKARKAENEKIKKRASRGHSESGSSDYEVSYYVDWS